MQSSTTEIIASINTLKDYRNSEIDNNINEIKSGNTIYGVFNFKSSPINTKGFIFDAGEINRNRVSLYINSAYDLIYRVMDNTGEIYTIKVPYAINKFQLNKTYLVYIDYGSSENFSFLRLFLNTKQMGALELDSKINFPLSKSLGNLRIGTDITNTFYSSFNMQEQQIYDSVVPQNRRIKLMTDVLNYYSIH